MKVKVNNINKSFGNKKIFENFSLELDSDKINCIIGESGGGKSTLLNMISGILKVDSGDITGIEKEEISYIFQEDRLLNYLTIKENMELFIYNHYDRKETEKKIEEIFKLLKIYDVMNEHPENLSGGMRQRVNIARALLKPSKLILMDEPFKSLDYKTKYTIMAELKDIFKRENRMVIFVTHDVDEAIFMEGNIYVLGGHPFNIRAIFKNNLLYHKNEIISVI